MTQNNHTPTPLEIGQIIGFKSCANHQCNSFTISHVTDGGEFFAVHNLEYSCGEYPVKLDDVLFVEKNLRHDYAELARKSKLRNAILAQRKEQ